MDYMTRRAELHADATSSIAQKHLGSPLVPVPEGSYSDEEIKAGAMQTADNAFYFIPCIDSPVMGGRGLSGGNKPIPGQFHWRIEVPITVHNYPDSPDDEDIVELKDLRSPSLLGAITNAAKARLDHEITNTIEGDFGHIEGILEKEFGDDYLRGEAPPLEGPSSRREGLPDPSLGRSR